MTRNLKVSGLAAVVALALTAVLASVAPAAVFKSSSFPTTLSGSNVGNHVIVTSPGNITCKKATFKGTMSGTESSGITLTPTYGECTFLGVAVTVNTGSCAYKLFANGDFDIVAAPGGSSCLLDPIRYSAPGCTITIPFQVTKKSLAYQNVAGGDITVSTNIAGIEYEESGFFCPGASTSNGTYNPGHITINGGAATLTIITP